MNTAEDTQRDAALIEGEIMRRGGGFPAVGAYVPGDDGNLYCVVEISNSMQTQHWREHCDYKAATVVLADYDDVDEDDIYPACFSPAKYGFECRDENGQWCRYSPGIQDETNLYDTREEAEAELENLADVLGCDASELRVIQF